MKYIFTNSKVRYFFLQIPPKKNEKITKLFHEGVKKKVCFSLGRIIAIRLVLAFLGGIC